MRCVSISREGNGFGVKKDFLKVFPNEGIYKGKVFLSLTKETVFVLKKISISTASKLTHYPYINARSYELTFE